MGDAPEPSPPSPQIEAAGSMTASSSSTSTNADNFTVLKKLPCSMSSSSKSQFNQVIFHDLNEIYPCDSDFRCTYSLTEDINPQAGDKISLFKVGWKSVSEYITFIRPNMDFSDSRVKYAVIPAADLPKEPGETLYQLCYISCGNVVAGASVPFSFHKPHESELVAVEDPLDPGLIVFRSRAGQLQDLLHLKTQKCEELQLECIVKNEQMFILRKELKDSEASVASLEKELKELRDGQLTNKQAFEENVRLCTQQEETITDLEAIIAEQQKTIANRERELEAAQKECDELLDSLKEYRAASETIDHLRREVNKVTQTSQVLKSEVQVKQLAVENLLKENERLEKQSAECEIKLKKAVLMYNNIVSEKLDSERELAMAENAIRDLSKRVEENTAFIRAMHQADPNNERQNEMIELQDKLLVSNIQLQDLKEIHKGCVTQISELREELERTREAHGFDVAELVSLKEEYHEKMLNLIVELESKKSPLVSAISDFLNKMTGKRPRESSKPPTSIQTDAPPKGETEEELDSKLRKMTEIKKELQAELVQVRHNRDEINACLKVTNEENASLKSRISVLELELAALKTNAGVYKTGGNPNIVSALEAFNKNIEVVHQFNKTVDEGNLWKTKYEEQKQKAESLQANVEDLLLKDAMLCDEVTRLKYELKEQDGRHEHDQHEMIMMIVENLTKDLKDMKENYKAEKKEKESLEKQLIEARKDLVGKLSVDSCKKIQEDNARLEAQYKDEKIVSGCLKNFVFAIFESDTAPIRCPMCPTEFPRNEKESFIDHFMTHVAD